MSARMRLTRIFNESAHRRRARETAAQVALRQKRKWNIVRGDKVQVVGNHREAGKQGIIKEVLRAKDRVLVENVNVAVKHIKGNAERGIKGRTIQKERSLPYSNVNLVDPVTNKPTRVYRKILEDGTKVRVAKKSGAIIPRPEILNFRRRPINSFVSEESDTLEDDVWAVSYVPWTPKKFDANSMEK
jgi:large subunit ribosomal protein L24